MRVYKSLKPGYKGTKELVEQFGDSLVCVRYRVDKKASKVYKTVELIVEERLCMDTQASLCVSRDLSIEESEESGVNTPTTPIDGMMVYSCSSGESCVDPNLSTTSPHPASAEPVHRGTLPASFFWFRFCGYVPVLFKMVMQAGACKGNIQGIWGLPTDIAKKLGLLESDWIEEVPQG